MNCIARLAAGAGVCLLMLCTVSTAAQGLDKDARTALRRELSRRIFALEPAQTDALTHHSYNDFGADPDCAVPGYYGGHAGIDIQTRSVEGDLTADEPVHAPVEGRLVGFFGHRYGWTAVMRIMPLAAVPRLRESVYLHLLHLRQVAPGLWAGKRIRVGDPLGI